MVPPLANRWMPLDKELIVDFLNLNKAKDDVCQGHSAAGVIIRSEQGT